MTWRERYARWLANERTRHAFFFIGCLLILITPVVGVFPGPGGILVFGVGAGMVLKNSRWAKKRYAAFVKRHPRYGRWTDWSLRRGSARRRAALARDQAPEDGTGGGGGTRGNGN